MKKWMYVIFPGALLGVFLVFYLSSVKEQEARDAQRAAEVARLKQEDDAKKAAAEAQARKDAEQRAITQAADEKRKEDEANAKWAADSAKIQKDLTTYTTQADQYSKTANEEEIELDNLHKKKEQENREDFDLLKEVELARVTQRNADLEIQRMVEMIAQKAGDSSFAKVTPPPMAAP